MKKYVLDGIIGEEYLVWVGDAINSIRGRMPRELPLHVFKVIQRLINKSLYATAH